MRRYLDQRRQKDQNPSQSSRSNDFSIIRPLNFEGEIIPVTQIEMSPSKDFLTSFAAHNVYQTIKESNITKFKP